MRLSYAAVSRSGEIGVDAEETSLPVEIDQVAKHFFSVAEQQWLAELPDERRKAGFYEQWVLKEAYLKGLGTGLAQSPESFTIGRGENGQPLNCGNWQFALHRPTPRHVAAVALHGSEPMHVEWHDASRLVARVV